MKKLLIILFLSALVGCNGSKEKSKSTNEILNHTSTTLSTGVQNDKIFPKLELNRYNVAFLIMDGVYNTELTAPYDIFQHTIFRDSIKAMNVFTVANTDAPVTTFEGMRLIPDFNYITDELPKIDILVIPSAEHHLDSDLEDEVMLNFVRKVDSEAQFITSHCDGAFVLAKAGLLNNVVSTTFPSDVDKMREMFPDLDIREDVLFVHDGKYITSAGGAKSFEAALYLSEYLYGQATAKSLAKGLVIDWDLDKVPHLVIRN
jgi:transcriptional regulator GlxA family with amidase domain